MLISQVDEHGLGLGERVQRVPAVLPTNPALFSAAERGVNKDHTDAVNTDIPRIYQACQAHSAVDILSKDTRHQAIVGIIGEVDNLLLGAEFVENRHRSKDLLADDFSVLVNALEDSRFDEVALDCSFVSPAHL